MTDRQSREAIIRIGIARARASVLNSLNCLSMILATIETLRCGGCRIRAWMSPNHGSVEVNQKS